MKKIRIYQLLLLVPVLFLAGVAGWYLELHHLRQKPPSAVEFREDSAQYTYINPLLFVDQRESPQHQALKKKLSDYVSTIEKQGNAEDISIYFRDLNTGKWTGVDENGQYTPSSMLKVVIMIDYLKQAETNPNILSKELNYKFIADHGQYYIPEAPLKDGKYSIQTLINEMITNSDNIAAGLLVGNDQQSFDHTYATFHLPSTDPNSFTDYMSPKSYSTVFRTLYNATYLSRDSSEKALDLLAHTTFTKGLVAGLPTSITVAHKFGEHTYLLDGKTDAVELHDCGIVYIPQNPYLLCVMTKGKDFQTLEGVIAAISKLTYENNPANIK